MKEMLYTMIINGGLGNQLFQIFSLLALHFRKGREREEKEIFIIENESLGNKRGTYFHIPILRNISLTFSLPNFPNNNGNCQITNVKWVETHSLSLEDHISYRVENYSDVKDNIIRFHGCFQDVSLFHDVRHDIFSFINLEECKNTIRKRYPYDYERSISLHFRLGDYLELQNYHPILPFDYYQKCLSLFDRKEKNQKVLVFFEESSRDHVSSLVSKLQDIFPFSFIYIDTNIPDYEQMMIMSLCRDNIIANSTFSWWGAYFNTNDDKKVYYPSLWHGPYLYYIDASLLFPKEENWIQV